MVDDREAKLLRVDSNFMAVPSADELIPSRKFLRYGKSLLMMTIKSTALSVMRVIHRLQTVALRVLVIKSRDGVAVQAPVVAWKASLQKLVWKAVDSKDRVRYLLKGAQLVASADGRAGMRVAPFSRKCSSENGGVLGGRTMTMMKHPLLATLDTDM